MSTLLDLLRKILAALERMERRAPVPRMAYNAAEVGACLGISDRTVRDELIDKGALGVLSIGTRVLVPAEELQRYVRENTARREAA